MTFPPMKMSPLSCLKNQGNSLLMAGRLSLPILLLTLI